MTLELKREIFRDNYTISKLYVNGEYFCDTLEDTDRSLYSTDSLEHIKSIKVYGKTAIPYGTYEIAISYSDRFKKFLPLLLRVPGYDGIRIHPGNTEEDTLGCILPGVYNKVSKVINSRITFNKLFPLIQKAIKKEKVFITISSTK